MARRTQLLGPGVRKAFKSKGDDTTLSRFVKVPGTARTHHVDPALPTRGAKIAASEGRTVFPGTVTHPHATPNIFSSGHNNPKIGRDVRVGGPFSGYWIYTLSLQERATCPKTCHHWLTCYGNRMPFAKRIDHSDGWALGSAIISGIEELLYVRGRVGILVRLHALGDFFTPDYVRFWSDLLHEYSNLAAFGYTAWPKGSPIGAAIDEAKTTHGRRFAIRWSGADHPKDCAVSIVKPEDCPGNAFVCPEQLGKTPACATCGACWNGDKNVAFIAH